MEYFDGAREIEIGIRGAQRGNARPRLVGRERIAEARVALERRAIFAVDQERQLAGLRFVDAGDAGDFEISSPSTVQPSFSAISLSFMKVSSRRFKGRS